MEQTRLFLTTENNKFYVINVYEDSDPEPKKHIYFPYNCQNKQEELKKARDFGQTLAKNLNTTLEEDPSLEKTLKKIKSNVFIKDYAK